MIQVHVAKGCGPTGTILSALLAKNGVNIATGPVKAHLCWGAGTSEKPALNGGCGRYNKLQQLDVLNKAGVLVVPFGTQVPPLGSPKYPLYARRLHHVGGRDIIRCRNPKMARLALQRGRAYFTQVVDSSTEFRVWVYRKRHLGTYEKVLKHPKLRDNGWGRNYHNGFAFELVKEANIPRSAVDVAIRSVEALGLDFGAVDILLGKDRKFYVLEVNTAPGVEGEGRQVIQSLATRVAAWLEKGCPARKSE